MTPLTVLAGWCAASLVAGAAWSALASIAWSKPVPPAPHEHRLVIVEEAHPYFGTVKLIWRCQTCPHREFLGMVWPDATNRAAA